MRNHNRDIEKKLDYGCAILFYLFAAAGVVRLIIMMFE